MSEDQKHHVPAEYFLNQPYLRCILAGEKERRYFSRGKEISKEEFDKIKTGNIRIKEAKSIIDVSR